MNKNDFINELNKIGVILSEHQLNQLDKYYNMLVEYNKNVNLTAITEYNQGL